MSQDDKFYQYGYSHYLSAPKRSGKKPPHGAIGLHSHLLRKLKTPAAATVVLFSAGALFLGVVIATYPSGDEAQRQIPIIKADMRPIKIAPDERGGMIVPHQDSTILARIGQPYEVGRPEHIENLLSPPFEKDLVSKEHALEQALSNKSPQAVELSATTSKKIVSTLMQGGNSDLPGQAMLTQDISGQATGGVIPMDDPRETRFSSPDVLDFKKVNAQSDPQPESILQKIGEIGENGSSTDLVFSNDAAMAAKKPKPKAIMARGGRIYNQRSAQPVASVPLDTMDFVRSVLNENSPSHIRPENVEPAAGAAMPVAKEVSSGSYFVQLSSIKDKMRAKGEWEKMVVKYNILSASNYRVQKASLNSGVFYRIQAGPMSKGDANNICSSLKNAGKPGGCLVVK